MLTRDDWRALTAIFWEYEELVLAGSTREPRLELATWLRDHDMPLLEIDRKAQRELPPRDTPNTPGHLLCHTLRYADCRFGFDLASGELVAGVLGWDLLRVTRTSGDDWQPVRHDFMSGVPPKLQLHARRVAGVYEVVVVRGLGRKGD